jgi:hypothetical protein
MFLINKVAKNDVIRNTTCTLSPSWSAATTSERACKEHDPGFEAMGQELW